MSKSLIGAALFALASINLSPAAAIDGEKLLTDAKAAAGGITPGDTAGYPITISEPGTYKLAGNLNPPDGKDGHPRQVARCHHRLRRLPPHRLQCCL